MASITDARFRLILLVLLLPAAAVLSGCAGSGRGEALVPRLVTEPRAPEVVWTYDSGRGIEVPPLVHGPDLLLATTDRRIHDLNAETGKRLWRKRIDAPLAGPPFVAYGHLVAATARPDGAVYTLDLAKRHVRWRAAVGDAAGGAVFFNNTILLVTRDGQVYNLSPSDGRSIWVTNLESKVWGTSCFDSTRALYLVPARSGRLFAVDGRSGEKRWVADLDKPLAGVASDSGGVAAVSIKGDLSYLDGTNGTILWSTPLRTTVDTAPVLAGDLVLVAGLDGTLSAFHTRNGTPAWRKNLGGPFRSEPGVSGNQVVISAVSGQVWLLDRASGEILGTTRHPETVIVSPVSTPAGWVIAGERGLVIAYRWEDHT